MYLHTLSTRIIYYYNILYSTLSKNNNHFIRLRLALNIVRINISLVLLSMSFYTTCLIIQ